MLSTSPLGGMVDSRGRIGYVRGEMIRAAVPEDLAAVSRTFTRSFWDDPVMRWLFPDDAEFGDGTVMLDFLRRLILNGNALVTPDVVAFSLWVEPGRPEVDVESTTSRIPTAELIEKFIALREALDRNMPPEPHWYLQMVGTHPDWQRRGIASRLINEGLSWARRDGVGVYLETETIENVAYYRHLGFEVRSEWDVDRGPHMWGMWRQG